MATPRPSSSLPLHTSSTVPRSSKKYYPIYDLVKILKVSNIEDEDEFVDQEQNRKHLQERLLESFFPPNFPHNRKGPVPDLHIRSVKSFRGRDFHLAAVLCSNSCIVVRFTGSASTFLHLEGRRLIPEDEAAVRVVTHFAEQLMEVVSASFSVDGLLLLVATRRGGLWTVPLIPLLFPSSRGCLDVNRPAAPSLAAFFRSAGDDPSTVPNPGSEIAKVAGIPAKRVRGAREKVDVGPVQDAVSWRSRSGRDFVLAATANGFLIVVDVRLGAERICAPLPLRPSSIQLCSNSASTVLLATGIKGTPDRASATVCCSAILLEQQEAGVPYWTDIVAQGDKKHHHHLLQASGSSVPMPPAPPVALKPPYQPVLLPDLGKMPSRTVTKVGPIGPTSSAQGLQVFDAETQELRCYDASLTPCSARNPLYIYSIGPAATCAHLTSATVIVAHHMNGQQKVSVLSRFAAACDDKQQRPACDATLQELLLPHETVKGFAPGVPREENDEGLPVDGVLLWTEKAVYELRPPRGQMVRPPEMFTATLETKDEALLGAADMLGKCFQLDILRRYEEAAAACSLNPAWSALLHQRANNSTARLARRAIAAADASTAASLLMTSVQGGRHRLAIPLLLTAVLAKLEEEEGERGLDSSAGDPEQRSIPRLAAGPTEDDQKADTESTANTESGCRAESGAGDAMQLAIASVPEEGVEMCLQLLSSSGCADAAARLAAGRGRIGKLLALHPYPVPSFTRLAASGHARRLVSHYGHLISILPPGPRLLLLSHDPNPNTLTLIPPLIMSLSLHTATAVLPTVKRVLLRGRQNTDREEDVGGYSRAETFASLAAFSSPSASPGAAATASDAGVEGAVLCLLRLAHLGVVVGVGDKLEASFTERPLVPQERIGRKGAEEWDAEAVDLLRDTRGEWRESVVCAYCKATGRLGVAAHALLLSRRHVAAAVQGALWAARLAPEPAALFLSAFAEKLFATAPLPKPSTLRRCIRVLLAFYRRCPDVSPEPLCPVFRASPPAWRALADVMAADPEQLSPLPSKVQLEAARCVVAGKAAWRRHRRQAGDDPVFSGSDSEDDHTPSLHTRNQHLGPLSVNHPLLLEKGCVAFSCGHPPLSVGDYLHLASHLRSVDCPIVADAMQRAMQTLAASPSGVLPLGCPACLAEMLGVTLPAS